MATFKCLVVSAREELYSGDISMLVASSECGELGILAGHTPIITLLKPGTVHLRRADGTEEMIYVKGGVLEVQPKIVTVLADEAEHGANLDEAKVEEARRIAEQQIANQSANVNTTAALHSLAESIAQLETIKKHRNRVQ